MNTKKWEFTGSLEATEEHVPREMYSFFRWLICGTVEHMSSERKQSSVNKAVMSISQTAISMTYNERQVKCTTTTNIQSTRVMPQQVAVGLSVHQSVRNKKVIELLHGYGLSIGYDRLRRCETQIAETIIDDIRNNQGVYVPADIIKDRYIFFAVDNVDFMEDTPDGKNTTHATALAIYQQKEPDDTSPAIHLIKSSNNRALTEIPDSVTSLKECSMPTKPTPNSPTYTNFSSMKDNLGVKEMKSWLIAKTLHAATEDIVSEEDNSVSRDCTVNRIPTWSAYNSHMSNVLPQTRVHVAPLIHAPSTEWSTLLTVLLQAQSINYAVMGNGRKTVITLDMGLYIPAKQLQMSRSDLDHIVLRPGELHIVMAALRCIGAFAENSGLDMAWIQSGLYGSTTTSSILLGKHVRRGIEACLLYTSRCV